jgi:uncharacterized protein
MSQVAAMPALMELHTGKTPNLSRQLSIRPFPIRYRIRAELENKKGEIMSNMNPVVHFEIPYEDKNRMANFYAQAFGWKHQMLGPEMGNYVVVTTSERDEKTGFPKKPGMINGGFFAKTKDTQYPSLVIAVDDIKQAMKGVKEAGGRVLGGEPDEIPGVGLYVAFIDTEGNRVGMLQPAPMHGQAR